MRLVRQIRFCVHARKQFQLIDPSFRAHVLMRLLRKTGLIIAIASTAACHDTSAPLNPVHYVLLTIDGRFLPTYVFSSDGPTVLSGSFILDGGSHATANELRHDTSGNEYNFNVRYRYTIRGDVIQFEYDPPCGGPAALCAITPRGTISGDHLLINYGLVDNPTVYDYRSFPMIDLPPG
jgi:hypothetical protein